MVLFQLCLFFFFFNDTATTEIYTLSLHDALPISTHRAPRDSHPAPVLGRVAAPGWPLDARRSEEHTSELQSLAYLVCRLLLEKKKKKKSSHFDDKPSRRMRIITDAGTIVGGN